MKMSPKGKVPWITLNGLTIGDSQFIIEYLSKTFDKDLSKNLSEKERAIERAFLKLTEESLSWFVIMTIEKYQNRKE